MSEETGARQAEEPEPADSAASARRGLALLLTDPGGFRLILATYDVARTRDHTLELLGEDLAAEGVPITLLDLSDRREETSLRGAVERHLAGHPAPAARRRAVHVIGIEALLNYGSPETGFALFKNANAEREKLSRIGAVSVVLWLDETASATFVRTAPDLWHWRYGGFSFTDPEAPRLEAEVLRGLLWSPRVRHHRSVPPQERALLRRRLERQVDSRSGLAAARRADLLIDLGWTHLDLGEADRAEARFGEAHEAGRQSAGRLSTVMALDGWGVSRREQGDPDQAETFHFRAVELARKQADPSLEARLLAELGADAYLARRPARADEAFLASRALAESLGEPWLLGGALSNLVLVDLAAGRPEDALRRSGEAREEFRRLEDRQSEAVVLANLGLVYSRLGRLDEAIRHVTRALEIHREHDDLLARGVMLANLAELHGWVGQTPRMEVLRREVLALESEVPALSCLRSAPPPVAIVTSPRDNEPMPKSRSQMGEAAWTFLNEMIVRENLGPADIELRLGWAPGKFVSWSRDRHLAKMEEYFEVLEAVTMSSAARLRERESRPLPSHADVDDIGVSPVPQVREPGRAVERDDWRFMERFLDLMMTRAIRLVQEGKVRAANLTLWIKDWSRKVRALVPSEEDDHKQ